MNWFLFFLLSSIILILLYLNAKKISLITGLYKKENDNTPLVGGLGIYLFFIFGTINFFFKDNNFISEYFFLFFFISIIFFIGIIDDIFNISYKIRLISISIILLIFFKLDNNFLINHLYFETFQSTYVIKNIAYITTPLFVILLLNSINMADGINGNSGLIFLTYFSLLYNADNELNIFSLFVLTSLIIFLFFNLKNKLYLGDSGVYFVSLLISLYVIREYNFGTSNISCEKIFLIFMIPGLDMFRLFYKRIYNKKNPFKGDLDHLHHLLMNKFKLSGSLIIYVSLIVWPNIIYNFFEIKIIILIIMNIIIFSLLIFYLYKLKKFPN